jgi:hypothetical protein
LLSSSLISASPAQVEHDLAHKSFATISPSPDLLGLSNLAAAAAAKDHPVTIGLQKRAPMRRFERVRNQEYDRERSDHEIRRSEARRQRAAQQNAVPDTPLTFDEMANKYSAKIESHGNALLHTPRYDRRKYHQNAANKWHGRRTAVDERDQAALTKIVEYYRAKESDPQFTPKQRAKATRNKAYYQQYLGSSSSAGGDPSVFGQSSQGAARQAPTPSTPGQHYYDSVPTTPYDWNLNQPGGNWRDDDYS